MKECRKWSADLTALAQNELAGDARQRLEEHLARCASCSDQLRETQELLSRSEYLPRLAATTAFRERVLHSVQVEKELKALSVLERGRLFLGYLAFRFKGSGRTRTLVYATAAQLAVLAALLWFSDFFEEKDPLTEIRSFTQDLADQSSNFSDRSDDRSSGRFLDQENESNRSGDYPHRIIEPFAAVPAPPTASIFEMSWEAPVEDLQRKIEQENRYELSRYRMYARLNIRCKNHVRFGRGGDDRTDYAVGRGLRWLHTNQCEDGSWEPGGINQGDPNASVGVTALALAAFLSEGYTRHRGQFAASVGDGLHFLLASQDPQGNFGRIEDEPSISLFNQSTAVLALAEHFILSRGEDQEALALGVTRLIDVAFHKTDGFGVRPPEPDAYSDTWAAMALRTAVMTGIEVPGLLQAATSAEDQVAILAEKEPWRTVPRNASVSTPPLYSASEGALGALFQEDRTLRLKDEISFPDRNDPQSLFTLLDAPDFREPSFLFFIGTELCEDRDPLWGEWNQRVKEILLDSQQADGLWQAEGNWPWIDGGDVYTTALHLLTLQVYYRYIKLEENCR
ncbi:MAG: zf-HC2 domain-containing protein [Planctomycetes bacterium]|nr:zf-HC2 domain-containing protein [Planctomycetota bacterium]